MAFDKKPSTWLGDGYSVSGNAISLTTADAAGTKALPEVTDAEADATTGDIRKVLFGVAEALFQAWNSQAAADRPQQMFIQKNEYSDVSTGEITKTYTLRFVSEASGYEVKDEPAVE